MAGNFSVVSPWFDSGTISADYTSTPFNVGTYDRFAFQYNLTGTLAGTFKLQASIDDLNYVDVPDSQLSIVSPNVYLISVTDFAYRYIKADFDHVSGTGEIVAVISTTNDKN
jgi:hypothetical protein